MRKFRADWRIRRDPHVLAASVVLNLLTFALPLMMLQIYDRIIPRKGFESLTVLAIGVVVAIALELSMRVARTHLMSLAGDAFARKTHERIFSRLLKTDLATVEKVTPQEWENYKTQLRNAYERMMKLFGENLTWNEDTIGGALSVVVHTAYHLGEIRQALCTLK